MIQDIRSYKVEHDLAPNAPITLCINDQHHGFDAYRAYLERFTFAKEIHFNEAIKEKKNATLFVYHNVEMSVQDDTDPEELKKKLQLELARLESEIARGEKMLSNPGFIQKAPKEKIALEQEKLKKNQDQYTTLKAKLAAFH